MQWHTVALLVDAKRGRPKHDGVRLAGQGSGALDVLVFKDAGHAQPWDFTAAAASVPGPASTFGPLWAPVGPWAYVPWVQLNPPDPEPDRQPPRGPRRR